MIQAPDGRRMSKSLGTGIDPLEEIDKHGADAVRFGLLAMSSTQDVRYSSEKVEQGQALATKLWNASRFVLLNVQGDVEAAPRPTTPADRWILSRLQRVIADTSRRDRRVRLRAGVARALRLRLRGALRLVPRAGQGPRLRRRTSRRRCCTCCEQTLALAHPVIPFVTEEIWDAVPGTDGLLAGSPFPQADPALLDAAAEAQIGAVIEAVRAVRGWRNDAGVAAGAVLPARLAGRRATRSTAPLVARLARLDLEAGPPTRPTPVASVTVPGGAVELLPAAGVDPAEQAAPARRAPRRAGGRGRARRGQARQPGVRRQGAAGVVEAERDKLERLREELAAVGGVAVPRRRAPRRAPWTLEDAERHLLGLELFGMTFGLDRMRRLLTVLGLPQERFRSVHVVGTNGKSSTARMIAAILRATGCARRLPLAPPRHVRRARPDRGPDADRRHVRRGRPARGAAAAKVDRTAAPDVA